MGVANVTNHLLTRDDPPSNTLYNPIQPCLVLITAKCLLLLQRFQRRQRRHRGWQWRRLRRHPRLWHSGGRTHGNKPAANGDEDAKYFFKKTFHLKIASPVIGNLQFRSIWWPVMSRFFEDWGLDSPPCWIWDCCFFFRYLFVLFLGTGHLGDVLFSAIWGSQDCKRVQFDKCNTKIYTFEV